MKLMPTNLGAEPKKVAALVGLLVVLAVVYYFNSGTDLPPGAVAAAGKAAKAPVPVVPAATSQAPAAKASRGSRAPGKSSDDDWRPSLKPSADVNLNDVDPTLNLALLARVREIGNVGGKRSLFEFYTPPPPPIKAPDPIRVTEPPKPRVETGPSQPVTAVKPPPPPIPLEFYGYSGKPGDRVRRAFFKDKGGEEIFLKAENEMIRDRYQVIRIGVTSAEVEDTVAKNRQTLPIVVEADAAK